eukprot:4126241-Amphidinium_carterae.1
MLELKLPKDLSAKLLTPSTQAWKHKVTKEVGTIGKETIDPHRNAMRESRAETTKVIDFTGSVKGRRLCASHTAFLSFCIQTVRNGSAYAVQKCHSHQGFLFTCSA